MNRPVRLLYDRATDMQMIGKRHPYHGEYHIAFRETARSKGCASTSAVDAGDTYDCSFAVMDLSLLMADGCYMVDTLQANGTGYRTNKTSNTAFRTFGTVQTWTILESVLERVALELTKKLGRKYGPKRFGKRTCTATAHLNLTTTPISVRSLISSTSARSGTSCTSLLTSRSAPTPSKNSTEASLAETGHRHDAAEVRHRLHRAARLAQRSSALVNVNMADGSVMVQHGGVEMGQGIHTKIAQLAANTLGIPLELIRVTGNNSDVIVNAPATAASTGYDLNGGAVEKACRVLRERLQEFCRDHGAVSAS